MEHAEMSCAAWSSLPEMFRSIESRNLGLAEKVP